MLARRINAIVLGAGALVLAAGFWHRNDLPGATKVAPQLAHAPIQRAVDRAPLAVDYPNVRYTVEPLYEYDLYGLVVSLRQHDGTSRMHRLANDHLNVADLCVVWGDNAVNERLGEIRFWNGIFTCNFETRDSAAWQSFKTNQVSNNHLITADAAIRERVAAVGIGDQVHIHGWLSAYGSAGHGKRGTSTTREDTGDGACETIFVDRFEIVAKGFGAWRAATYAALAVVLTAVIVHFRLPYRPYD